MLMPLRQRLYTIGNEDRTQIVLAQIFRSCRQPTKLHLAAIGDAVDDLILMKRKGLFQSDLIIKAISCA